MTFDEAVRAGARRLSSSPTPFLDARILLKFATGLSDAGLVEHSSDKMTAALSKQFEALVARRERYEPIAYITGMQEFWGLEFSVSRDVLIPRADSECLVETVLSRVGKNDSLKILELGTGSGCLIGALLSELPNAKGVGADISPAALKICAQNGERLGFGERLELVESNWFSAISGTFDVIIANPPYIRTIDAASLPAGVAGFEPGMALFAGPDGLDDYRRICPHLIDHLAPEGMFVGECGLDQTAELAIMVNDALPRHKTTILHDLSGRPRGVLAEIEA